MTEPTQPTQPKQPHPGGARWCETHLRWECTKRRNRGRGTCHAPAIGGLDACRMHVGMPLGVAVARGQAVTAFSSLGAMPAVDPGFAVLSMLHVSFLRAHLYAGLLEDQVEDQADDPVGGWGEDGEEGYPRGVAGQPSAAGVAGLIGHTYSADKVAGIFASGEARRALVDLEAQERDRCVRYAKTAHDMGIAEREVKLAESQGQLLASVVRNILGDLELSEEQQARAAGVIQRRFREAAVGELEQAGGAA